MSVVPPEASFRMPVDVVGIQDAELGLEAQHMAAVLAHHAHAQRVEGADQHILARLPIRCPARSRISTPPCS